jgi:hypothetical protein
MSPQRRRIELQAHPLQVVVADAALRPLWECSEDRSPVVTGASVKQGMAKVQLAAIQEDVEFLMFVCYGEQLLGDEIRVEQQQLLVLAEGSLEIIRAPYKYSRTKNTPLWFVVARDGFSGWAIANIRVGIDAASEDEARATFVKVAQAALKY